MAKVKSKIIQNGNVNYVYATLNGIDTSNVLATYEDGGGNMIINYTATQDCYAILWGGLNYVSINDVNVKNTAFSRAMTSFALKKGSNLKGDGCFKLIVFGIKR